MFLYVYLLLYLFFQNHIVDHDITRDINFKDRIKYAQSLHPSL